MNEKHNANQLPLPVAPVQAKRTKSNIFSKGLHLASVGLFVYLLSSAFAPSSLLPNPFAGQVDTAGFSAKDACPQPAVLTPSTKHYAELDAVWKSSEFKAQAVDWLSGAVQVETESYDGMPHVGEDDRWNKFAAFHDYLEKAFPKTHKALKLTKVNSWGLAFEWTGSDPSLKPLLLMGHQDVVPVEKATYDAWEHPPFSGHYDGTYIWGRGSVDDKSGLVGIMSAVESILGTDFTPKRTTVLSFGFDEEVSGPEGAAHLAKYLEETYGTDGFALILDEGGGYQEMFGTTVAALGTGEKGYADVRITVNTLGGHSSVPPDHTSIGLLSLLIAHLESHPHSPYLTRNNPFYTTLVCAASYGDVPKEMDSLVKGSLKSDKKLLELEGWLQQKKEYKSLIGTSQAVDLVGGGVKVNALPEKAWAVVNSRINVDSSTAELKERTIKFIAEKAKELNLTLSAFGEDVISSPGVGQIVLDEAFGNWLEPAPITPTTPDTKAWNVLAGSIKSTYGSRILDDDFVRSRHLLSPSAPPPALSYDEIVTAPSIMTGNTDTKFTWRLSRQIYRYNHVSPADFYVSSGVHSVNEALKATAFVNNVRAFGTLILNVNENDI